MDLVKVSCPTCRLWRMVDSREGTIKDGTERRHGYLSDCIIDLRHVVDEATAIIREQNQGRSATGGHRLNDFLESQSWP